MQREIVAHHQPVERVAIVLALQDAVATDLGSVKQPGDLGAELGEGRGETRQRAGRQLRRGQRCQTDVQRTAPLLIHLINPDLRRGGEQQMTAGRRRQTLLSAHSASDNHSSSHLFQI